MPFHKQRTIPAAVTRAAMPATREKDEGVALPTKSGAGVSLPAPESMVSGGGSILSPTAPSDVYPGVRIPAAASVVVGGGYVKARSVQRACPPAMPSGRETAPHCDGNGDGRRERAALAGRKEAYGDEDCVSTRDAAVGVPVPSLTAYIGATSPGIQGGMTAGIALHAASSVVVCGGIATAGSTEQTAAASLPAAGDAPAQSGSALGTYLSTQAAASDDYPVECTTVPTMGPLLREGNLVVCAGGTCGNEPEPGCGRATTAVTAECANNRRLTATGAKKRNRSISGPAARIAPNEELALTLAIKTWETRKNDPIFFPYEGTKFNSFEEARDFYNLYSWEVGFGVRISRGRTNDNGYVTKKDLCCSCAGHCPNDRAASSRTGCRAMIRLLRLKDHEWKLAEDAT